MKQLVQQFLDDLQIRNYSPRTITDYGYHLKLWLKFLQEHKITELARITESTLAEFQRGSITSPPAGERSGVC